MIKAVVILVIAGIAGLMAYLALVGECPGGKVVFSPDDCIGKLKPGECNEVFARADEVARTAGTVFIDPVECSRQFGPCLEHAVRVGGWTPRPAGFCVNRIVGVARPLAIAPVYRADGGRRQQ
jgi:uncharacterized protein YgiB involved in biofilm formation